MNVKFQMYENTPVNRDGRYSVKQFGIDTASRVNDFHKGFEEYTCTPLVNLKCLAADLGIKKLFVKDESTRFGQNAFKVLGSSYAVARIISDRLGMLEDGPKEGEITLVTATDGNHGRGLAWTAQKLGQKCVVFLPKGSEPKRLEVINALGAKAFITDYDYDDTVRYAKQYAKETGAILIQDTSWEGYEDVPLWIMQGYTTMACEIVKQLEEEKPTHIFLQAGVGSMAAAMTGFFTDYYGREAKPIITIIEPNGADCLYQSAKAGDGKIRFASGKLDSVMAGLNCGEPNPIAWDILKNYADFFITVPDEVTVEGMKILSEPLGNDPGINSGETGAVPVGVVASMMRNKEYNDIRDALRLDGESSVLCFSTEGTLK